MSPIRSSVLALVVYVAACTDGGTAKPEQSASSAASEAKGSDEQAEAHLATFDDLDFNVFSNQKWDELSRSHSQDITVHMPDGRVTKGIGPHIEDLKKMFIHAPDTRIKQHPIKIGSGDWTAVTGVMEGTFTKPMPTPDGKSIPPTGKAFKITMATIGHWKDGVMDEEYLFWDNQTYMKQIGVAP